jgi:Holliday junction resolvase-like predicted endonuclease
MASARTSQQQAGDDAEAAVADALVADGWAILGRHVHVGRGELDLVAVDPGPPPMLVVVEVRWRRDRGFGLPEETFDHRKRAHLRRAVARLLAVGTLADGSPLPALPVRVDLVAVEPAVGPGGARRLRHHRAALEE